MIALPLLLAAQAAVAAPGRQVVAAPAPPRFESENLFVSERPQTTRVVVSLPAPADTATRIPFRVSGTATPGRDFVISASPLVIPAGQTQGVILLDVLSDDEDEDGEQVTITLGGGSVGGAGAAQGPPSLTIDIREPKLGDPINGLTNAQLAAFNRGRIQFERRWKPSEGLGPFYNATSCVSCHSKPVGGGGSDLYRNFYLAVYAVGGNPANQGPAISPWLSPIVPAFGSGDDHATTTQFELDGNRPQIPTTVFGSVPVLSTQRNSIPMFGVGLFEHVSDATILSNADPGDSDGDGISGTTNTQLNGQIIGRFGLKAQSNNIEMFTRGPLQNQMGITSDPLEGAAGFVSLARQGTSSPTDPTTDVDPVPDPEIDAQELGDLIAFTKFLAPPEPRKKNADALAGEVLFDSIGCTKCHIPTLPSALGPVNAYTDLLLHDMGDGLKDDIRFADYPNSWREFRTQPLWGVSLVGPWLHDGRAATLREAILAHGGEAQAIRDAYNALTGAEKNQILEFLESL